MTIKYITWSGGPAGDYTTDGTADQTEINQALAWAHANPNNTITLRGSGNASSPHTYLITNQILIGSKTIFNAEVGVKIKVANLACGSSGNSIFPDSKGVMDVIVGVVPNNLEITGFEFDGNCQNQYNNISVLTYHGGSVSSGGTGVERLIDFRGDSGSGTKVSNVEIHHIHFHDAFGEGVHIMHGSNINVHDCPMENCEHDGVMFTCVNTGEIANCAIDGIVDSCVRVENCQSIKIHGCLFTSYNGSNNIALSGTGGYNQPKHGENGIQLANNSAYKTVNTSNIEIYNNTFDGCALTGIWINDQNNTAGTTVQGVKIYQNSFINCGYVGNSTVPRAGGIAFNPWGNGVNIYLNIFDGCHTNAIQFLSHIDSTSSFTATITNNNIINTQGKGTSGSSVPNGAAGYGIYNAKNTKITASITGNYFAGNVTGNCYLCTASNNATASISTAGAGTIVDPGVPVDPGSPGGGSSGGVVNPGSGNSVIPTRYIPMGNSVQQDWIFDGYYDVVNANGSDHTAFVNGVAFTWQKKSLSSSQSVSVEHPAGIDGDNIGDFGERGATITLSCIAESFENACDIIASIKARTPTIVELGGLYRGWYFLGTYQDRSSEIDNTNIDEYAEYAYPYDLTFLLDKANFYSTTKRIRSRKIFTDGQVWNSDDSFAGNLIRNPTFDSWTANTSSTWAAETSAADNDWYGLVWSPDLSLFAAVSSSGTNNRVMTSADGIAWNTRTSAANNNWKALCWGDGLFVAVSDTGTGNRVMTSANGTSWSIGTSAADTNWASVCYAPFLDLFCAVGSSTASAGSQTTLTDTNGANSYTAYPTLFTQNTSRDTYHTFSMNLTALSGGQQYRFDQVMADLVNVTGGSTITYAQVTIAANSTATEQVVATWNTNATSYTAKSTAINVLMNPGDTPCVRYYIRTTTGDYAHRAGIKNPSLKYTPITSGSSNLVMTSPDGTAWTARTASSARTWSAVCWAEPTTTMQNGRFVAVAGTGHIMTSDNGILWTGRTTPLTQTWTSVCYSIPLQLFVAVSEDGTTQQVITSSDGITWTPRNTPSAKGWSKVRYADEIGIFAAVAKSGTGNRIMSSPDGITWNLQTSPSDNNWNGLAWSPSLSIFAAVSTSGTNNRAMISTDFSAYSDIAPDGWTKLTDGQSRDDTGDEYGYLITGDGYAEFPGGSTQVIKPQQGVPYILAANAYTEGLTTGKLNIEIYADNAIVSQITWDVSDSIPTPKQRYITFDMAPVNASIIIQGMATPENGALIHLTKVIFEKASDYEIAETGNSIVTFGSSDATPDIEVSSSYMASASTTTGQQNIWKSAPLASYTSVATLYSETEDSLEYTAVLPALSSGNRYRIDEVFTNLGTDNVAATASMKIKLQAPSLYGGVSTILKEWTDSTHVPPNYGSYKQNVSLLCATADMVTFRFYLKTSNASYKARIDDFGFKYSIVSTTPISGGVSLYNTADPLTVMRVCNSLRPGCKVDIKADYTGFFEYYDSFVDDSFLDNIISAAGVIYDPVTKSIAIADGGYLVIPFDTLYTVTGIPFLNAFVIGALTLQISTDNINWYACDGNTSTIVTNSVVERQLNDSDALFNLKGNSVFYVKVAPYIGTVLLIGEILIHADLNTMDCQRIKIRATGQPESMCALLDAPANVIVTEKYNDTRPAM